MIDIGFRAWIRNSRREAVSCLAWLRRRYFQQDFEYCDGMLECFIYSAGFAFQFGGGFSEIEPAEVTLVSLVKLCLSHVLLVVKFDIVAL